MKSLLANIKKYGALCIIKIFNLLPIKDNKIFIFSYYGNQYGCSPKYISQYIIENSPKGKFDIVWAFNDVESKRYLKDIRKVKIMSLKYFYELCTSKIIITNFRTTDLFIKRQNQYYIQTWHSSLRLKMIEKDAEESLPKSYVKMAKNDSKKCDLLLSGCKYSSDIFKRSFWYDGEIFEYGIPRNDMLLSKNNLAKEDIKDKIGISNKKVILYAPTFRKNNSLEAYNLDYSKIIESLKEKFEGDWVFLVRLHPHLISKSKELIYGDEVLDVTGYDDIQELLSISDILISDYSSLIFDFYLTNKPCYLYVPDLTEYINNDRKLYFDINTLPFIIAKNNEELIKKINSFNNKEYIYNLKAFSNEIGSFENGLASEHLLNHIEKVCFG